MTTMHENHSTETRYRLIHWWSRCSCLFHVVRVPLHFFPPSLSRHFESSTKTRHPTWSLYFFCFMVFSSKHGTKRLGRDSARRQVKHSTARIFSSDKVMRRRDDTNFQELQFLEWWAWNILFTEQKKFLFRYFGFIKKSSLSKVSWVQSPIITSFEFRALFFYIST